MAGQLRIRAVLVMFGTAGTGELWPAERCGGSGVMCGVAGMTGLLVRAAVAQNCQKFREKFPASTCSWRIAVTTHTIRHELMLSPT